MEKLDERRYAQYVGTLKNAVANLRLMGYVVTVEQVPLKPLAMGHHMDKVRAHKQHRRNGE